MKRKELSIKIGLLLALNIYLTCFKSSALISLIIAVVVLKEDIGEMLYNRNISSLFISMISFLLLLTNAYIPLSIILIIYTIYKYFFAIAMEEVFNKDLMNFINDNDIFNNQSKKLFIYYLSLMCLVFIVLIFMISNNNVYIDVFIGALMLLFPAAEVLNHKLSLIHIYLRTRKYIRYKSIYSLYKIFDADIVVFDKSKVILQNNLEITSVESKTMKERDLVNLAAALEKNIDNDIADCLRDKTTKELNIDVTYTKKLDGGYQITAEGNTYLIGSYNLMTSRGIDYPKSRKIGTQLYVCKNSECLGLIILKDNISEDTIQLINILKNSYNKEIAIVSGDNFEYVKNIASKLNIDRYISDMSKEDKVKYLKALNYEKLKVCFIGSSDDDDAILKEAYVSVDLGKLEGYDIDIDRLEDFLDIFHLSKQIFKRRLIHTTLSFFIRLMSICSYLSGYTDIYFSFSIILLVNIINSLGILEPSKC